MSFYSIVVGLTMIVSVAWQSPPLPPVTGAVVFGDIEVSTMLTANKTVPATFFTNCVRTQLDIVLNSQSTIDWMMTSSTASPTCSDSANQWTMTPMQRSSWNQTPASVKLAFMNSLNQFRAYAVTRPSVTCTVSGLTPASPGPYTSVSASPDPSNPDRFTIKLTQLPGGGGSTSTPSGKE